MLDDFRVSGRPFPPHPHAGFSALTYAFEDSPGSVRGPRFARQRPCGWSGRDRLATSRERRYAPRGPAETGREVHGAQIFVNLKNKLIAPRTLWLTNSDVPEWRSNAGDRVRVVVRSFDSISSPLIPPEPFNLLDIELRREISFGLQDAHYALVYVLAVGILVRFNNREQKVAGEHALALHGSGGRVTFEALHPSHFLILSGAEIREPVLVDGPFIMNEPSQIVAAAARYRTGEMGHLAPLS